MNQIARSILPLAVLAWSAVVLVNGPAAAEEAPRWPGEKSQWNGYDQYKFDVDGVAAYVVTPGQPLPGNPWVWRARFPDYHAEMDIELIKQHTAETKE